MNAARVYSIRNQNMIHLVVSAASIVLECAAMEHPSTCFFFPLLPPPVAARSSLVQNPVLSFLLLLIMIPATSSPSTATTRSRLISSDGLADPLMNSRWNPGLADPDDAPVDPSVDNDDDDDDASE